MSVNNDNISLGFRDLLFNSGVACMLLFIIFSVRMGKDVIQVENVNQISNKNHKFIDAMSLIVTESVKEGKYKSLIAVEVKGITIDDYQKVVSEKLITWSIDDNEEQYISYDESNSLLTCYMIVSAIPKSNILLTVSGAGKLKSSYRVLAKIIDGKTNMENGNNDGYIIREWTPVSFNEKREIIFRPAAIKSGQTPDELQYQLFDLR